MFEEKSMREILDALHTDTEKGLTEEEAAKRLQEDGPNVLKEGKKKTAAESFLEQLNDPLICVLLVAALVSFLLKEVSDAAIIAVVIIVNATVGVIQEGKAQKALEALKKLTSPKAVVRRGGTIRELPASELVKGDVVILETGAQVAADLRLVRTWNLKIEESALTGESLPVNKDAAFQAAKALPVGDRKNEAFMSTLVTSGRGEGVVIGAGMETEIGKIASIISAVPKEFTPLQKKLADLGKILSIVSILLCAALFGIAVLQHRNIMEMLITAISLAVAAVPEGLPAIVTIVLALSVSKMVKVHTIVRKLPSVETLGAVNVVCSDKTGTLTQNKMTVIRYYVNQNIYKASETAPNMPEEFLEGMALCNDAVITNQEELGDPTELALLRFAEGNRFRKEALETRMPRVEEKAFDSQRKMMTTVHRSSQGFISYTKGAPEMLLDRCSKIMVNGKVQSLTEVHKRQIRQTVDVFSSQALRVLAVAVRRGEKEVCEDGLTFVGLAGMIDPIRPEAKTAVEQFKLASVRTIMITGDHIDTAFAIARELGIAKKIDECMTGEELEKISDVKLKEKLKKINVFARVSPEHKVRIVKALKETGNIAAMTGDGVNDAPSLRMADIGIAMGITGTDVAKNAADMILTDDNFATIEKAIEEGRSIYENIRKTVLFLLSSNFGEIITMFIAVILGMASPLKASHILWINLITDSLPALALGVDKNDKEALMKRPPRKAKEGLFSNGGTACTIFYGCLIAAISLTAFLKLPWEVLAEQQKAFTLENISMVFQSSELLTRAQTYAFTVLGISQLFHAQGMQDVHTSIFSRKRGFNPVMAAAFGVGFLLQAAVTEVPALTAMFGTAALSLEEWGALVILAAFPVLAHEIFVLLETLRSQDTKGKVINEVRQEHS
ncbi:cation-translocating P-type ATPase [Faecalicatena contorta]|uniref:P-type Ca(2+) transporter n=1 Tax=Faecalicatena contorta TaxID=39482 RepID=A0A315ZQH3_9FIRM|nr:cation-translocating P-type ATPase [Faecalicatena contorta]PWJ47240.1 Ca2+-transporting ATPase [Faecalicatena contorta]SUQ16083.1 Ca2+-transporting ATPase [Faecalicatena contorta]